MSSLAYVPTMKLSKTKSDATYSTYIRRSVIDSLEDSEAKEIAQNYWSRMSQGFFDSGMFSALIQPHVGIIDIVDAAIFSDLWTKIFTGEILWTSFHIGRKPEANDSANNARVLNELKGSLFLSTGDTGGKMHRGLIDANFEGESASVGDGLFNWREPVEVGCNNNQVVRSKILPAGHCVLEVGTTEITTTYFHLKSSKMLARWPYDSDTIYLFSAN